MGAIDDQLAHFFEVSVRSVRSWRVRYPEFAQACQLGKEVADERVEASLFSRAVGYSFDSEKILTSAGQIFREAFVAHIPPDVKACVIWLTNRRPAEWRVNPAREANGSDGVDLDAEMRADAPLLSPPA
jgi:hypothetical protein